MSFPYFRSLLNLPRATAGPRPAAAGPRSAAVGSRSAAVGSRSVAAVSVLLLVVLVLALGAPALAGEAGRPEHLVIISIDALNARDQDLLRTLPNIGGLMTRGVVAPVMGVYPSNTYPSHASISTGALPERTGIAANHQLQPEKTEADWYWWADNLHAVPIWEVFRRQGLKTAAILWPETAGAHIDDLVPEIQANDPGESQSGLILKNSTWSVLARMFFRFGTKMFSTAQPGLDDRLAQGAAMILKEQRPNLLLLHLVETDSVRHAYGAFAPEVQESLRRQDRRVGWILQAARDAGIADRTIFAVIGDHGFADAPWAVHLNVALRQAGLLRPSSDGKVADWQAFAICEGGVANVYVRDPQNPALLGRVRQVLDELKADPRSGIDAVRTGQEAQQLFGASPLPAFYVEARPGYSLEPGVQGDLVTRAQGHPGTHGFRPDLPGYRTLFIAAGPGIAQNRTLPEIRLIDEAPTLCRPFGLVMPDAQGVVVAAALAQDEAAAR